MTGGLAVRELARRKLLSTDGAVRAIRAAQRRGEQVVFTNGCFDFLHLGHLRSLGVATGDSMTLSVAKKSRVGGGGSFA